LRKAGKEKQEERLQRKEQEESSLRRKQQLEQKNKKIRQLNREKVIKRRAKDNKDAAILVDPSETALLEKALLAVSDDMQ
jgi:hypothetical protein